MTEIETLLFKTLKAFETDMLAREAQYLPLLQQLSVLLDDLAQRLEVSEQKTQRLIQQVNDLSARLERLTLG